MLYWVIMGMGVAAAVVIATTVVVVVMVMAAAVCLNILIFYSTLGGYKYIQYFGIVLKPYLLLFVYFFFFLY